MMMGFEFPGTDVADRWICKVRNLVLVTLRLLVIVKSRRTITRDVTNFAVPIFTRRLSRFIRASFNLASLVRQATILFLSQLLDLAEGFRLLSWDAILELRYRY